MMKIRWVLVLLFFVSFLSTKAMACSCSQPLDDINAAVQEAYTGSASVVLARVENIQQLGGGDGQGDDFDVEREITQFSEIQSWKGEHGKQFYTNIPPGWLATMVRSSLFGFGATKLEWSTKSKHRLSNHAGYRF